MKILNFAIQTSVKMESSIYLFWNIYKKFNKKGLDNNTYNKSSLVFSMFFSIPLTFILWKAILPITDEIVGENYSIFFLIVIFLFETFITNYIIKIVLPENRIKELNYTKEEKRKYNRNILLSAFFIISFIILITYINFFVL